MYLRRAAALLEFTIHNPTLYEIILQETNETQEFSHRLHGYPHRSLRNLASGRQLLDMGLVRGQLGLKLLLRPPTSKANLCQQLGQKSPNKAGRNMWLPKYLEMKNNPTNSLWNGR